MEGKEKSPSHNSEESTMLDLPSVCDLAELFLPTHGTENTEELCHSVDVFPSLPTENWSSILGSHVNICVGLCEPTEPHDAVPSWMYECDSVGDPSIRKSLDDFYKMYCTKQSEGTDPTYEAASRCLSQKISELANRDGTKYASRCLQMAQLVLNRDGCKIFPNYPPSACFSKPAEGEVSLEDRRRTPGLSDDILQFLLKQTQAEHS
ncbi:SHLD1 protein, partial [Sclerurus mexicanus]|nr:SHLD1 protein [Sclerurus mexicanus]